MRAYTGLVHTERSEQLTQIAEIALGLYGLGSVELSLISSGQDTLFQVDVPHRAQIMSHPYLGKLGGQRFLLQVRDASSAASSLTYEEVAWLAELLRETELNVPEPVPANNGALVTEIEAHDIAHMHQCVLFRCHEGASALDGISYAGRMPGWSN